MKITRTRKKDTGELYRLEGEGVVLEKKLPGDGVAISWAAGVLCFRAGDNREGTEVPMGDYTLTIIGVSVNEPLYRLRKHDPKDGTIVSWEGA